MIRIERFVETKTGYAVFSEGTFTFEVYAGTEHLFMFAERIS